MTAQPADFRTTRLAHDLDDIDREVARLAMACRVPVLDPGVIERVLKNDEAVCGTRNPAAFKKLRDMLMMHYYVRDKVAGEIGQVGTQRIVEDIVARLKERIGKTLGGSA